MKVGIIANPRKQEARQAVVELCLVLSRRGIDSVLETATAAWLGESGGVPGHEFSGLVDAVAVLGGDGTMLNAVASLGVYEKPAAGIHSGRLLRGAGVALTLPLLE